MRKRAPNLEWQIAESDAEWERLQTPPLPDTTPDPALATHSRLSAQRVLGSVAVMLFLLAGAWWWRTAQVRVHPRGAEVRATAHHELGVVQQNNPLTASLTTQQEDSSLRIAVQADILSEETDAHVDIVLHSIEVWGEQAVVRVILPGERGAPAYRQTRFYQHTEEGWRQVALDAAFWGPERSLETSSFVFQFRQNDAPVVIAVAPQIEALYTTLRRNVGLPISLVDLPTMFGGEKLIIDVSVTQSPGNALFQQHNYERFVMHDRLVVASPALYLAPVELTDADLLAQSIALPLLDQVLAQTSERYGIDSAWQPLLNGLRLWQVWDLDLPLAAWRGEMVQWLYLDLLAIDSGQSSMLPGQYSDLCAAHKLWLPSPMELDIPLFCNDLERTAWPLVWSGARDALTRLDQLAVPASPTPVGSDSREAARPARIVALATLVEYAVATYGREHLPALVAGLGHYDTWDTLIPAVFGVSAAEFEAGWQAYLTAHYGVPAHR